MGRFRATPDGNKPLTAAQETQRDQEEADWAARVEPTRGEVVDARIGTDDALLALIGYLADQAGTTERAVRDAIKAKLP